MSTCLCGCPSRLEAAGDHQPPVSTRVEPLVCSGKEGVRTNRQGDVKRLTNIQSEKIRRRDANNFKLPIRQRHLFTDYILGSSKLALPESVTNHHARCRATTLIVGLIEDSPKLRPYS